jgi:UDP-N-acetylmuramate: L-alanyl-gamma-D-glutamyl-meso-diaminopimelate ligase
MGEMNVRNALGVFALCRRLGLPASDITPGLQSFRGVRRRQEVIAAEPIIVIDDFAHHPTAIAETLAGVRSAHPDRRIWAIFEPRSATSCRKVFQSDFVRAFGPADRIVLPAVFRSTLPEDQRLSVEQVIADLKTGCKDARHIPQVADIVTTVAGEAQPGDLVVIMSNGGFDDIHQKLLTALEQRAGR